MRSDCRLVPFAFVGWMAQHIRKKKFALAALACLPALCTAHPLTKTECTEGGDFIRNAALSRDGGMSESLFIEKIRDDVQVIRSLPPKMRWFVQDDEDAEFLIAAATEVFRNPKDPADHQSSFLALCLARTTGKNVQKL